VSIGHDLARGRGRFFRVAKAGLDTSTVADGAEDALVGGEPSIPLAAEEAPVGYGDGLPEPAPDEPEPTFDEVVAGLEEPARPADAPPPRRSRRVAKREPVAA
jgi:single-strand DNA-binding protein